MGRIIVAPEYRTIEGPLIFLAGPIQGAPRWQDAAANIIGAYNDRVMIASPRRPLLKSESQFTQEMYNEQVDWETFHLRRASENGAILFWLAKEAEHTCERAYGQTTRFELAEWKVHHEVEGVNLVVGIEEGFTGARYIRRRISQDCIEIPVLSSLEETCRKAVDLSLR